MSHVDEGLIHAYIDGAFPQGNEQGEEIEAHMTLCVDCRVRMENARELKERAQVVMHRLVPNEIATPPFSEVLARRNRERAAAPGESTPEQAAPRGGKKGRSAILPIPFAWAATVILAVGAGWMGRELMLSERTGASDEAQSAVDAPRPDLLRSADAVPSAPAEAAAGRDAAGTVAGSVGGAVTGELADRARAEMAPPRPQPREAPGFAPPPAALKARVAEAGQRAADERRDVAPPVIRGAEASVSPTIMSRATLGANALIMQEHDIANPTTDVARMLLAYTVATRAASWSADPLAAFGMIGYEPPARLDGASAVRFERATANDIQLIRSVYAIGGDTVEVVQQLHPTAVALNEIVVTGQRADSNAARRGQAVTPPPARDLMQAQEERDADATPAVARIAIAGDEASVFDGLNIVTVLRGERVIVLTSRMASEALEAVAARIR